jgi:hypothetical protein
MTAATTDVAASEVKMTKNEEKEMKKAPSLALPAKKDEKEPPQREEVPIKDGGCNASGDASVSIPEDKFKEVRVRR